MTPCIACNKPAPERQGFCPRHWAFLPYSLHRMIWADRHNVDLLSQAMLEIALREEPEYAKLSDVNKLEIPPYLASLDAEDSIREGTGDQLRETALSSRDP